MTHYEMAEKLSEKIGVTLEEASEALEACDWEMLDAALLLEREHGGQRQAYSTRSEDSGEDDGAERPTHRGPGALRAIGRLVRGAFNLGNRNHLEVSKGEEQVMEVPVTVLVVLLLFAFWVCVPLLVIGLFLGYRYSFSGAELGREGVNRAMDKAAEVAEKLKDEVTGER